MFKGTEKIVAGGEVYDLNQLVEEKQRENPDTSILEAKFRITTSESAKPEMLNRVVKKLGHLNVVEIKFDGWSVQDEKILEEQREIGTVDGKPITLVYHTDKHWHVSTLADFLKGKTFKRVMEILNSLKLPFNAFDEVEDLTLENGLGTRIRFGCQSDCMLTLQYSSDPHIYQWFADLCITYNVPFSVGVCGKIRKPKKTWTPTPTGETEDTDWTCII